MLLNKNIFFILLFTYSKILIADDNCSFYLEQEIEKSCLFNEQSSSDYFTNYGYFFCRKFQTISTTSNNIKSFVNKTRSCLQNELKKQNKLSCNKIESIAFDSHPRCYKNSGYCTLTPNERQKIFSVVFGLNLLNKIDKSIIQYSSILHECHRSNENDSMYEVYRLISEDIINVKTLGFDLIKNIFYQIPDSVEKTDKFFKKALSVLKYGTSNKNTDKITDAYLVEKYSNKTVSNEIENCFNSYQKGCSSYYQRYQIENSISQTSTMNSTKYLIDINQKLKEINDLKNQL